MQDFFRVGVIVNTHGLKGEVRVYPTTEDIGRFSWLKRVFVQKGKDVRQMEVLSARQAKGMVILRLEGLETIDEAEKLKGWDLMVAREDAIPLEEGEHYVSDLLGCTVRTDDGRELGPLTDVLKTGTNDVLVVGSGKGEILIPYIDSCVLSADTEKGEILVHLMEGLA